MKKYIVIILLQHISFSSFANDSLQILQQVEAIKVLIRSGNDSVNTELNTFYQFAVANNNSFALANYHHLKGFDWKSKGKYNEAIQEFKNAIAVYDDSLSSFSIDHLNRIAHCYKDLTEYDKAYFYFQTATRLGEKGNYLKGISDGYAGIGQLFEANGKYEEGMVFYLKSKEFCDLGNDSIGIASCYNNIGNMMFYQGEMEQAMSYYKKSIAIDYLMKNTQNLAMGYGNVGMIYQGMGELDSSLYYTQLSMREFERINNPFYLGTIYNNIALVYFDLADYEISLDYHFKSKKIKEEINDLSGLVTSLINIGNLYVKLEKYAVAIPYYEQAMEICNEINTPLLKMNAYKGLSKAYQETGNYKEALNNYIIYSEINDSLNTVASKKNVAALETEFETKQKDELLRQQEISHQNELALKTVQDKNKTILLFGTLLLLLVVVLFGFIFYRKLIESRRQRKIIEDKNKENELLLGEIHHRVKNNLQVISSLLSLQEKNISDVNAKKAILEGKERVKSMGLIHKMLYQNDNFSGIEMNDYIIKLVEGLMDSFGMTADDLEFKGDISQIKLDVDTAIPLGLIINELVINALKYAYTQIDHPKMTIKLKHEQNGLQLEISDNGTGTVSTVNDANSFGQKLVKSLVRQLNGELLLEEKNGLCYQILIRNFKLV